MPLTFSPKQIQDLLGVVDYFTTLFVGQQLGNQVLSQSEKAVLRQHGIDVDTLTGKQLNDAFRFGTLASALQNSSKIKNLNYAEFKRFLASGGAVPLTKQQQYSLGSLKQQAYGDIKGLGNRMQQALNGMVVSIDQKQRLAMEGVIEQAATDTLQKRGSVQQLSSLLGEKTKDWARDFDRIADYIMHSAYQRGIASTLLDKHGKDADVYYDVYEEACEHCIRTYLTAAIGSEPKVFKLTDVLANGNNIGRKPKDYLPSVDPLHPWCRCTMNLKPANTVWSNGKWILVRNNYGVQRKSKVTATITTS